VNAVSSQSDDPRVLNDDLAWCLSNAPVPVRDAWPLRLLPAFLRTPLKARIAARQYEQTLITLWEKSPHLLEDIGVILVPDGDLADHLIAAPNRVFKHVMAPDFALAKQAVAAVQPKPAVAPVPRPSATRQVSDRTLPDTLQADVQPHGPQAQSVSRDAFRRLMNAGFQWHRDPNIPRSLLLWHQDLVR